MAADLSIEVNGMMFEDPFVLGSGPPGTNAKVIAKSFDLGWGAVSLKPSALMRLRSSILTLVMLR